MSNADVFENFIHSKEFHFERNDLESATIFSLRDQDMSGTGGMRISSLCLVMMVGA